MSDVSQMPHSADVVIAGGAAIGSSVAYHLASNPDFSGTVVVVEKDPTSFRRRPCRRRRYGSNFHPP